MSSRDFSFVRCLNDRWAFTSAHGVVYIFFSSVLIGWSVFRPSVVFILLSLGARGSIEL